MDLQLADKRALVTGSTSGIGAEIVRMLALEGVKVVVHGRDRAQAQAVVTEIEAKGGQAAMALGDLMTADGVETVIKATEQAIGSIDILVNNAGGSNSAAAPGWFETPAKEWVESYRQNALAGGAAGSSFRPVDATARMGPVDPDLVAKRDLALRPVRPIWRGEGGAEQPNSQLVQGAGGNRRNLQWHYAWAYLHAPCRPLVQGTGKALG